MLGPKSPTLLLQASRYIYIYKKKTLKTAGPALPPPVRALRPLPQRQGPNPPPSCSR